MKKVIFILFSFFSLCPVNSQNKKVLGDTLFQNNWKIRLIKKFNLSDFSKSNNDFDFRLWSYGQVIEVSKNQDSITAVLTNYAFHFLKRKNNTVNTLFEKEFIEHKLGQSIYEIITRFQILNLPSYRKIPGWCGGCDGITYVIEYANKQEYWLKDFWTPTAQDTLKEAVLLQNFIIQISDTLNLKARYKKFREKLPKKGCYRTEGITISCYMPNSYSIGYQTSTIFSRGYQVNANIEWVGNLKTNFGFKFSHQFNNRENLDLSISFGKPNLIFKEKSNLYDFVLLQYREKKSLNEVEEFTKYRLLYGFNIAHIGLGAGIERINTTKWQNAITSYFRYSFLKANINTNINFSFIHNSINYKFTTDKSFTINKKIFIRWVTLSLYHEYLLDKNNSGISIDFAF